MAENACSLDNGQLFACAAPKSYNIAFYRSQFPTLAQNVHGKPLVYLDTGASAQKPRQVLNAMQRFYEQDYANIHRGVHELSQRATHLYEEARQTVRRFLNASSADEIIFTHGATEGINLVANSWGRKNLRAGDEVVLTTLEHHANIVPWQMLQTEMGISLKIVPVTPQGEITLEDFKATLSPRTKLVALAHVSNALGTILPVAEMVKLAHAAGALALVDGCQAAPHLAIDVQSLNADFYVFGGHKIYGPTGIGILFGKASILQDMPPYQGGGDMIASVSFSGTTFKDPPHRFEAGTPPIAEAIGLAAAIDFLTTIGMQAVFDHDQDLLAYVTPKLQEIPGLRIVGTAPQKAGIISFVMDGAHPHDIGTILDRQGVAIRAGHHCAQPLMEFYKIPATARASFGLYTTKDDLDKLIAAIQKVREIFA